MLNELLSRYSFRTPPVDADGVLVLWVVPLVVGVRRLLLISSRFVVYICCLYLLSGLPVHRLMRLSIHRHQVPDAPV